MLVITLLIYQTILGQTRDEIRKFAIYRIDQSFQYLNKPALTMRYYDSIGRLTKRIEKTNYDSTIVISEMQYVTDSLVSYLKTNTCKNEKEPEQTIIQYDYKFNEKGDVTEKLEMCSNGEIIKEVYAYNSNRLVDTIFKFDNNLTDRAHSLLSQKCLEQTLSLRRVLFYSYQGNMTIMTDCCYPVNKACGKVYQTIITDTLIIYTEIGQLTVGDIGESTTVIKQHRKNGLEYLIEECGLKSFSTFKVNKNGLVTKDITKHVYSDKTVKYDTTTYNYYYRQ